MKPLLRACGDAGRALGAAPVGATLASGLVLAVISAALWWTWTQIPFLVFGLAPLVGGYVRFCAALARGRTAAYSLLLSGFSSIDRWTGVVVMVLLHLTLTLLPLCVGIAIANLSPPSARWLGWAVGAAASTPLFAVMLVRLALVPVVAIDVPRERPVAEVFDRARQLVEGRARLGAAVLLSGVILLAAAVVTRGLALPVALPFGVLTLVALHDRLGATAEAAPNPVLSDR